ncbi:SusC/RagA family TonB-linked outer membrane protein [Sphingobacterium sp. DK4209]|uniref:SusC/RagA family TonB-linked outer membrane protein n=1 Tax=Sphingobacterium zhuxiongii TaxID=2662364 RepID=A0A5Q0Q6R4_9SPHI|nr:MULTISPECIES: SusC/RagA family TonB-linked outer membrane protein [unclassified Sphingobacterium]MVZ67309.1 SusC/RagA family TonB-linked outer membrane protein [Sphingobacterium sp. DK4209]QGA25046.1 SusC/RagA family TonB-linked outer membrane protein [Sphingobacterium sp. dk4302]
MKIKLLMYLAFSFSLLSIGNTTLAQRTNTFTLQRSVPLKSSLKELEKKFNVHFNFNDQLIERYQSGPLHVENGTVEDCLRSLLQKTNLSFRKLDANTYSIFEDKTKQSKFVVRGLVLDASGAPLRNASVKELGGAAATESDNQGQFEIEVSDSKSKIRVSHVSFQAIETKLDTARAKASANGIERLTIILNTKDQLIDSVTVVVNSGYQKLSKERSTGSFSVVKGSQLAEKSGSMNVLDRLEGLTPGLAVNYGEGNDKMLMRGVSSVNLSRKPLVVLDGVPMAEYNDIESLVNPQDVQDVTMLRDATAASIWGAQAANGVIVITTKSGNFNSEGVKINYDGFVSLRGTPSYDYMNRMSSSEFIDAAKGIMLDPAYVNAFPLSTVNSSGYPKIYPHEQLFYDLNAGLINDASANRGWDSLSVLNNRAQIEKYFYSPSLLTSHNMNFSGGGKVNRFYSSVSYNRNNKYDKSSKDRFTVSLKEEWNLSPRLNIDLTANMAYENYNTNQMSYPMGLDDYTPYAMFADASGNALDQSYLYLTETARQAAISKSKLPLSYVPLNEEGNLLNNNKNFVGRVNAGFRLGLIDGLNWSSRAQFQKGFDKGYSFANDNVYRTQLEKIQFTANPTVAGGNPTYYLPIKGGEYSTQDNRNTSWTFRTQLDYEKKINELHQLTLLAGFESRNTIYDIQRTYTKGYDFQTQKYSSFDQKFLESTGVSNPVLSSSSRGVGNSILAYIPLQNAESELRFVSFYGNAAYSYDNRYNFNGSLRYDQSNLFGKNSSSQNKPIWSTGLSWNIHNESFFTAADQTKLTLRVTYGIAGNSPKPGLGGPYDILYAVNDQRFEGLGTGYIIISPANNQLVWEKTNTFNAGIDFAFLQNRISGSLDFYDRQTSNLLGERPVDPTTGWSSSFGNLGDLYNRGFELGINTRNISKEDFQWSTNFNIAYNKSKITKLKNYVSPNALNTVSKPFVEGYSAFSLLAFQYAGLDQNGNPQVVKENGEKISFTRDLELQDVNYEGTTQPLVYGGMTNTFNYKNVGLSFLLVYNFGHVMRQELNNVFSGRIQQNLSREFDKRWKQAGDEAITNIPKYIPSDSQSENDRAITFYNYADANVQSASYLRLRDVTLSYVLPKDLIRRLTLERVRIYAQANNILLWTKNKDNIDPEYYNLASGYRVPKMPAFYTFGLNLNF